MKNKNTDETQKNGEKESVEYLQAKPYNSAHEDSSSSNANISTIINLQRRRQGQWKPQEDLHVGLQRRLQGRFQGNIIGYIVLFVITALIATVLFFGFIVLLIAIAVMLPIWLVLRAIRAKKMTRF